MIRSRWFSWLIFLFAAAVGAALAIAVLMRMSSRALPDPHEHLGVGRKLSALELAPLTGNASAVKLPQLAGHVTLLNIWGTWCPPCRLELPHMANLVRRFAGCPDFRLLAVSYPARGQPEDQQSLHEETMTLLNSLGVTMPTYHDVNGTTLIAVNQAIDFRGFPTTILLDRRGVIRAVWVGYRMGMETQMERCIDELLDEQDEAPAATAE